MNLETTQFDIIRSQQLYKFKKNKNNTLNNNNSCNNNFEYCFNQLYYDCKHLIVIIIVECGLGFVQISDKGLRFNNCSLLIVINGQ
jgi:hypothetical protein